MIPVPVSPQALEEAAANAAEEEERRLQTQTELQDRYKMDLEKEMLVRVGPTLPVSGVVQRELICRFPTFSGELVRRHKCGRLRYRGNGDMSL